MNVPSNGKSAVVIGAGIVGASCALRLQTHGFEVALIERQDPGKACSFGNAGRIATSLFAPKSAPGLLRKVPRMLRDRNHPLKTRFGFVIRNFSWFRHFAAACTPSETARITDALSVLLSRADAAIDRLTTAAGARDVLRNDGVLYIYKDPALAEPMREALAGGNQCNTPVHAVTGDQIRDVEPTLPVSITCGFYKPEEWFVRDPFELTTKVVAAFVAAGGTLVRDEVTQLEIRSGGAPRVRGRIESYEADKVVIAAGAWSPRLTGPLGINLLLIPERGYHAMLPNADVGLKTAIHYADRLVSMSPMRGGLRVTSGAELMEVDAASNWDRRDVVIEGAKTLYPNLDDSEATRWMGPRPSTPDSLPIIGAHPACPDVLFATGHGTLGLTLSAITAEIIGDLAEKRVPNFDVAPYQPDRF